MAIITLDGAIAGAQPPWDFLKVGTTMEAAGVYHSLAYASGMPGAAVAPTPGIAGAALTSYAGQIQWSNPPVGNSYLFRFSASASVAGTLILYDRLWHNSGIAVTTITAQIVNSVVWPPRDRDGLIVGNNVLVAIEVSTATTNVAAIANTTMSYTNQAGISGRTGTMSSFPATAVAGTLVPFQLAAGDTGVRSVQSVTLGTSYGGGTIHLVAFRWLAKIGITLANVNNSLSVLSGGFMRLYDNTVPFLMWLPTSTTAVTVSNGEMIVTQG